MIDKNKLRAAWIAKGMTQSDVAREIGVSDATFSRRLRRGEFGIDEAELMIKLLDIKCPMEIFFAQTVT